MNKTLKFGYDALGAYCLVKLNVKLTDIETARLDYTYHQFLKFIPNYKGLTRIEGVLHADMHYDFTQELKVALLRSKIEVMSNEVNALTRRDIPQTHTFDWTKADLDKI